MNCVGSQRHKKKNIDDCGVMVYHILLVTSWSQWPCGLRRRSAATRLLRSWVQIPPGAWMFVCCKCCVLSGRGLCDKLITRPEESYRLWCVVMCDLETSRIGAPYIYIYIYIYDISSLRVNFFKQEVYKVTLTCIFKCMKDAVPHLTFRPIHATDTC